MTAAAGRCRRCRAALPGGARYCPACGEPVSGGGRRAVLERARIGRGGLVGLVAGAVLGAGVVAALFLRSAGPSGATGETPAPPPDSEVAALEARLRDNPRDWQTLVQLANFHYDRQQWQQAALYYGQAVAIDPTNPDLLTDYGTALHYSGRHEQGIARFEEALQRDPKHLNAHFNLAIVLTQLGRGAEAVEWWEKFLALAPAGEQADFARERLKELRGAPPGSRGGTP